MLVFWDQKLILLSVPKTGTTALEGALTPHADLIFRNPPTLKHAPVQRFRRFLKPMMIQGGGAKEEELRTVAAIRHPMDWLSSWYRYRFRDEIVGYKRSTRNYSFDEFVVEYLKGQPAPFANVGAQAKFLLDGDGNLGVDYLFRYESGRLQPWLENQLSIKVDLNQRNVSPKFETPLSPNIEAKLRRKFDADFALWEAAIS